jgi:hypothetical protein
VLFSISVTSSSRRIWVAMAGGDPDAAARKLVEIADAAETVQDGRIFIERVNGPRHGQEDCPNFNLLEGLEPDKACALGRPC